MGDGFNSWTAAVYSLDRDGLRVGKGVQVVLVEEGRIEKTSRGARINQRPNRYGRMVGEEEVN